LDLGSFFPLNPEALNTKLLYLSISPGNCELSAIGQEDSPILLAKTDFAQTPGAKV
jgi:hypothetical protein